MKQNRHVPTIYRVLIMALSVALCIGLLSACSITDILSKGTDLIDKLAQDVTGPSGAANDPSKDTLPPFTFSPGLFDPTSSTTEAITDPTFSTDPADTRCGIVKPDTLPLYAGPSQTYDQVDSLKCGQRVRILHIENGWVYVAGGWALLEHFYIEGDIGTNFAGNSTVTGTDVNLREGPGRNYEILNRHNTGDQLYIYEQIYADDLWWGCTGTGWICMDYVYINATMGEHYGFATVTGDVVNIRQGPGTNHSVVGSVKEGQVLEVFHYITVKGVKWCCIDRGWICMDYVHFVAHS